VYVNPLTYATSMFRYVTLKMDGMSEDQLVNLGVSFRINNFVISPWLSAVFIMVICVVFFYLCVNRFSKADFSNVKTFKHK